MKIAQVLVPLVVCQFDADYDNIMADFGTIDKAENQHRRDQRQRFKFRQRQFAVDTQSQKEDRKFLYSANGTAYRKYELIATNQHQLSMAQMQNAADLRLQQDALDSTNETNLKISAIVSSIAAFVIFGCVAACLGYCYFQQREKEQAQVRLQEAKSQNRIDFMETVQMTNFSRAMSPDRPVVDPIRQVLAAAPIITPSGPSQPMANQAEDY